MLRSITFGLFGMFLASLAPAQDWARGMFATNSHDFGSVARGAKAEFAFEMTNNFQSDVHIAGVRTSCGCTTPSVENDKRTLKTYEKGAILAHLNSDTHLGQRAATLTVTFDQPTYAEVQLQIKALVHSDVLMEPASLGFGTVERGKAAESHVRIYRANYPNWRISALQLADPSLKGEVVELARRGSEVWYDLKVHLSETASPGYIGGHALLTTNDPGTPQIPVQIEGQVRPDVSISPAALFLGVMKPGEKVTKPLVVRGEKPFRITAITGDKASFELPAAGSESKMMHIVPVTFIAGAELGKVVKTIHIETDMGGASADAASYAVVGQ